MAAESLDPTGDPPGGFGRRLFPALARALARRPALPLGLVLLAVAAGAWLSTRVAVDPGNEALFLRDDPARAALERFDRVFSGERVVLLALEGPVFSEDGLARLERATLAAARAPGVRAAVSLTNAKNIYEGPLEAYAWPPYERVKDGDESIDEFRDEVLHEPLFAGNLVALDGRAAAVICELSGEDARTVPALREVARSVSGGAFAAHVAGFPVERFDFADFIRRDQAIFLPLVVVVLAVMTGLFFRQLWGVLLPLGVVGASVALALGVAGAAGIRLNALTSMVRPVVMVVAVAASVNICAAYAQAKAEAAAGAARADVAAAALGRVGPACFFTTLTTAIGFASLAASRVPAIQTFGLLCAFGVSASYAIAVTVLPPLLSLAWPRGPGSLHLRPGRLESALAALAPGLERRRRAVIAAAALLGAAALGGVLRLRVETDIIAQLPPGSELARATRAVERSFHGVNTLEVLFEGPPGAFRRIEGIAGLAAVQAWLDGQEGVARTFSIADILARISEVKKRGRRPPVDQEALDYELGLLDRAAAASGREGGTPLAAFVSPDASAARLTARLAAMTASRTFALIEGLRRASAARLPAGLHAEPTGQFVLVEDMTAKLPAEQVRGVVIAAAAIVASIGLFFRSLRTAALAAIPASLPILFIYGLMGWAGIDLSVPTAMISSIVLGLAVDSTILFLARYGDERRAGAPPREAVARMLESAGQAVSYSNVTLVAGFLVGAVSSFPPVRTFSLLTAATIAASWGGALALLPSLIFSSRARPG